MFKEIKPPTRPTPTMTPKAKLRSLPLNHLAIAAISETYIDSVPMPKSKRPDAMTHRFGVREVITAPEKRMRVNSISERRMPMRSVRMPPITKVKIVGKLYAAWINANIGVAEMKLFG